MTWVGDGGAVEVEDPSTHLKKLVSGHKVKKYWRGEQSIAVQGTTQIPIQVDLGTTDKRKLGDSDSEEERIKKIRK